MQAVSLFLRGVVVWHGVDVVCGASQASTPRVCRWSRDSDVVVLRKKEGVPDRCAQAYLRADGCVAFVRNRCKRQRWL